MDRQLSENSVWIVATGEHFRQRLPHIKIDLRPILSAIPLLFEFLTRTLYNLRSKFTYIRPHVSIRHCYLTVGAVEYIFYPVLFEFYFNFYENINFLFQLLWKHHKWHWSSQANFNRVKQLSKDIFHIGIVIYIGWAKSFFPPILFWI